MPKALFITCSSQTESLIDDELFMLAFEKQGYQATLHPWNGDPLDWSQFDLAIVRSAWDYYQNPKLFLRTMEDIELSGCRLWNPLSVLRWNADKSYLQDLQSWGLKLPPTLWSKHDAFQDHSDPFKLLDCDEVIVKPTVSVGAFDTLLLTRDQWKPETLRETYKDREVLVQKCLSAVREEGEYSLVFFAEEYSHGILKKPKPGDFRVQSFHGGQESFVEAPEAAIRQGQFALSAVAEAPLYARVDLVQQDGEWVLMELELIEPQLFLPGVDFETIVADRLIPFIHRY